MARAKRAKKSKMSKKMLIIPGVLIGMSASILWINANMKTNFIGNVETKLETYNESECIKDIFTQENTKYLPIKYSDSYEQITKEDIEKQFNAMGMSVESISSDIIKTGTQIKTKNATYTVIIYGDIDGNGKVNVRDAQRIVKHLLYGGSDEITGINRMAANVEREKENNINVRDAHRIIQFILGKINIIDSTPTSDIENDKEAPVITLNGEKEITLKVFEQYIESGATATDDFDPNVIDKIQIDTSRLNVNKPGVYDVTYNVTDASGKAAQTVTRIVRVEDYIRDINIHIYPSQQYVDGEKITLDNMIAYPINAYGGEQTTPIDIREITIEPDIAVLGMTEYNITYKGITKTIPISVTERKPIITFTGHDDAENLKIKVYGDYIEGATAWDELDQKNVEVFIEGEVDTETPGKYVIKYTTAPNSLGKVGQRVRTVEVVDYITEAGVDFEVDDTTFKKQYVDGETISLNGIKAYANYRKAGKQLLDNSKLSCDIDTVVYNRTDETKNIDREIIVSYKEYDEVDKQENIYSSIGIKINVVKKFETIQEEVGTGVEAVTKAGDIYDYMWIARVKSGDNEETLSLDKINISVKDADTDKDGCITRAWGEQAYRKDSNGEYILDAENNRIPVEGAVDIYFMGVSNKEYEITVEPRNKTQYTKGITFNITPSTNETRIDKIEIGEFTTKSGDTRFKSGDTIVADVKLYHIYGKEGQAGLHEREMENVLANRLKDVEVTDESGNAITGITGKFISDNDLTASGSSARPVRKIEIESNSAKYTGSDDGEKLVIKVSARDAYGSGSETIEKDIFAQSRYELSIGNDDIPGIKLSLRKLTRAEYADYEVKEIGDNYYTILPIRMYDQYVEKYGDKDRDITTKDLLDGDIVIDDTIHTNTQNSCIDVIGLTENGIEAQGTQAITKIGIAILNREDDLESSGTIKVQFKGKEVRTFNPISIERRDISSIKYVSTDASARNFCYEDIMVAKVSSGARQLDLTLDNKNDIGCIIEKVVSNNPKQTVKIEDTTQAGFSVPTVEDGVATIEFWAKESGTYEITPYIIIDGKEVKVEGENPVAAEVMENRNVTRVTFNEQRQFGSVPLNGVQVNPVEFWHVYTDRQGKEDPRMISGGIDYNNITITPQANFLKYVDIKLISENTIIEGNMDEAFIDEISVTIDETILENSSVSLGTTIGIFTIQVTNDDGTKSTPQSISATIGAKAVIDGLRVGNVDKTGKLQPIKIYTTTNDVSDTNVKKVNGKNYTLVPITYTANTGKDNEIAVVSNKENKLSMSMIGGKLNKGKIGKIAFVDNVNDRKDEDIDYAYNCISIEYFDKNRNRVIDDATSVAYVGLALAGDDESDMEFYKLFFSKTLPEEAEGEIPEDKWVQFKNVSVYYDINGEIKVPKILEIVSDL